MATHTKGDVIVEEIKVGDIHYEYGFNMGIKSQVISLPTRDDTGYWSWQSKNVNTGKIIDYGVHEGMSHYAPNLYTNEAYTVNRWI